MQSLSDPQITSGTVPENSREACEHARDWLALVDAGRMGAGASSTNRQLMRHFRNEQILLGGNPKARRNVRLK